MDQREQPGEIDPQVVHRLPSPLISVDIPLIPPCRDRPVARARDHEVIVVANTWGFLDGKRMQRPHLTLPIFLKQVQIFVVRLQTDHAAWLCPGR